MKLKVILRLLRQLRDSVYYDAYCKTGYETWHSNTFYSINFFKFGYWPFGLVVGYLPTQYLLHKNLQINSAFKFVQKIQKTLNRLPVASITSHPTT